MIYRLCLLFVGHVLINANNVNDNVKNNVNIDNIDIPKTKVRSERFNNNYKFLQKHTIDSNGITTDDWENLARLKKEKKGKWIEVRKAKKKDKPTKIKEYQFLCEQEKLVAKKFEKKNLYTTIYNAIVNKSYILTDTISTDSECPVTVNELRALRFFNLLDTILKHNTEAGKIFTGLNAISENNDINENIRTVKVFQNLDINELDLLYKQLSESENDFLSIFNDEQNAETRYKLGDNAYNAYIDFRKKQIRKTPFFNGKFARIFLNPFFITTGILNIVVPIIAMTVTSGIGKGPGYGFKFIFKMLYSIFGARFFPNGQTLDDKTDISANVSAYALLTGPYTKKEEAFSEPFHKVIGIIFLSMSALNVIMGTLEGIQVYKYFNPSGFYKKLRNKYYHIKSYISSMEKIFNIISNNNNANWLIESKLKYTNALFNTKGNMSKEQTELMNMLTRFPKTWSYWKNWGAARPQKFCRFFYLFDKYKDMFINPIVEINRLEQYVATVKLLNNEAYKGKICFPTVVDLKTPMLSADECWNPFLNPSVAVTNNIRFGIGVKDDKIINDKGEEEIIKNGHTVQILYGMNAGGKTTTLESVGESILTSTTLGIAFAKNVTMTKFKRVYTLIDITTDLSKGYSRYMSEVVTCDDLLNEINKLKPGEEHMFVICDELFAGTNPEAAGKLSCNVINSIVKNKNVLLFMATHNIKPTELEKTNDLIKNYVMRVDINENGIKHRYKMDRGLKTQSIAEAIIRQMQKNKIIHCGKEMLGSEF